MNSKTCKKLRRFAKRKGLKYKAVKSSFLNLTKEQQLVVMKEVVDGEPSDNTQSN